MATEVEQHVKVDVEAGIGWIRLNRPDKMNAIGTLTRRQLGDAIKRAEKDEAVHVVVLTGSGRAFRSEAQAARRCDQASRERRGGPCGRPDRVRSCLQIGSAGSSAMRSSEPRKTRRSMWSS